MASRLEGDRSKPRVSGCVVSVLSCAVQPRCPILFRARCLPCICEDVGISMKTWGAGLLRLGVKW
jgi:hypothetical protein